MDHKEIQMIPANPSWTRGEKLFLVTKTMAPNGAIKTKLVTHPPKGTKGVLVIDWLLPCPKCGVVNDLQGKKISDPVPCKCGFVILEDTRLSLKDGVEFFMCESQAHYNGEAGALQYSAKVGSKKHIKVRLDEREKYGLKRTIEKIEKIGKKMAEKTEKGIEPEQQVEEAVKKVHRPVERRERAEEITSEIGEKVTNGIITGVAALITFFGGGRYTPSN